MHFVGMLGLRLPVSVSYDIPFVLLSVAVAVVASGAAFALVSSEVMGRRSFWAGGVCMGVAITGMHYTGMTAMRLPAVITHDARLVALSAAIAIGAPFAALRLAFYFEQPESRRDTWPKAGPALLMGLGIVGMHYSAMTGTRFTPIAESTAWSSGALVATPQLATVVALGTCAMLGMAQLGVIISRREEQVQQGEARFRLLADRVESAREEERTRIAREIHDELGQALTVLQLDLNWLESQVGGQTPALRDKIQTMTAILRDTLDALQRIAAELRPPALDRLGLRAAIAALAREFESRTGVQCRVEVAAEDGMVDGNRATAVYRILQEALTNVARHAQASRVDIVLRIASDELELIVRDNGRGVSQEQLAGPRSLGILGMWERANSWGGELSVAGAPGAGTIVRLTMPLVARRQPQSTP